MSVDVTYDVYLSSLIAKLTANQRLLLHHVILVLRNISAHKSVTRMTSANLAVCVAPAMLWHARRASLVPETGDRDMMRDAWRLSVVVQRIIDAKDPALFGDDLVYPTPFDDVITSPSSLCVPDELVGNERCTFCYLQYSIVKPVGPRGTFTPLP